jgi:DNA-binding beta-propeller fold protein YncE
MNFRYCLIFGLFQQPASANTDNLLKVDVTSGVRTIISDNTAPDTAPLFDYPMGILIDKQDNRALIADDLGEALLAVDLDTGVRSAISSTDDNGIFYPNSVTAGDVEDHVLVTDYEQGVLRVNLSSGERETLHPVLNECCNRSYVHYVPGSAYVYWLDGTSKGLYALDLQSHTVVTISKSLKE